MLKRIGLPLGLCLALAASVCQAGGTVHSLDQARGALDTKDGRKLYDQAMQGSKDDPLGMALPAGFTPDLVVKALAPQRDPGQRVLAGVKPWPQQPGKYVAIACLARSAELAGKLRQYNGCDGSIDPDSPLDVWFGVFERDADAGAPRLLARTMAPIDVPVDWQHTRLGDAPDVASGQSAGDAQGVMPESWNRFDLAAYQLKAEDYAFGVRAGWEEGYSGGGASFEALYLLRMDGPALRVVFAQPMAFMKDIAGDWHKDGTRDHDMTDGSNVLVILKSQTNGMYDLQLRKRGDKQPQTFHWSGANQRYQ